MHVTVRGMFTLTEDLSHGAGSAIVCIILAAFQAATYLVCFALKS